MRLYIQGKGEIVLTQREFMHQGGEGSVYRQGDTAYKIYIDPSKMIPLGKIQDLSSLTLPNIVSPKDVLLNTKNSPVGYSMLYVPDAVSLCQIFPRAFKLRNNITSENIANLVLRMKKTVEYVHNKHFLLVDLNEMNFLVDIQHMEVYFIDTDSYQTPHFPATALMPSVKDWHAKSFSELSDWFSFAIVTFQLFTGVHPYRGRHPIYGDNFEERMKRNLSVFNSDVRLPPTCESFDTIPETWRDWYQVIFSGGRVVPPDGIISVIQVKKISKVLVSTARLKVELINQFDDDITNVFSSMGTVVTLTKAGIYIGDKRYNDLSEFTGVAFTPFSNLPIAAVLYKGKITLYNILKDEDIYQDLSGQSLMQYEDRLYLKSNNHILETKLILVGNKYLVPTKVVGRVLGHASQMFDGVVIQDLLCGDNQQHRHNALVFPSPDTCYQIPIPELDKYRVVDAKFDNRVLGIIAEQKGRYDRFVFRFDEAYETYDAWCVTNAGNQGLNFVVLDSGVCVLFNEEGKLELFRAKKGDSHRQSIEDAALQVDFRLYKDGSKLLAAIGSRLFHLTLI